MFTGDSEDQKADSSEKRKDCSSESDSWEIT